MDCLPEDSQALRSQLFDLMYKKEARIDNVRSVYLATTRTPFADRIGTLIGKGLNLLTQRLKENTEALSMYDDLIPLDLEHVTTYPLASRPSKVSLEDFARPSCGRRFAKGFPQ